MNTDHAVQVAGLCKSFGNQVALHALDLEVPRGALCGLLGCNGAGKTTLLRSIMGLLRPDSGAAHVFGSDLRSAPIEQRARVAYVPQEVRLMGRLSLERHARIQRHFYPRFDIERARELAKCLDVDWKQGFGALSVGSRRKAVVALALASQAELIVLDEPAAGLDPLARRELYDLLIESLGDGGETTVLLSSHLVNDLERLADRVAIIDQGRTLKVDDVDGYTRRFVRVQLIFPENVRTDFVIPGAASTTREGCVASGVVDLDAAGGQLAELEARSDVRASRFPLQLEEVFVELVGKQAALDS